MNWEKILKEMEHKELEDAGEDVILSTSSADWKEFQESAVWEDFKRILVSSLVALRTQCISTGQGHVFEEVAFIQGEANRVRVTLDLPKVITETLEAEEKIMKEEKEASDERS
jgi:hypothetical protein